MLDKNLYKNKYRVSSTRLGGWDYSEDAFYFITICTKNFQLFFGDIVGHEHTAKMDLSKIGEIVESNWISISEHFKCVKIDKFAVMPNHFHGIIKLENNRINTNVEMRHGEKNENCVHHVETRHGASLRGERKFGGLQKNSISSIINQFKGSVTRWCKDNNYQNFSWQPRFYDRVIRNLEELNKIRQYIIDNPGKWSLDRNNPENIKDFNDYSQM